MAADVPTIEPLTFRAGDTVTWEKSLADYPAGEGWALTYYIVGPHKKTVTCTTDGDTFVATITAEETTTFQAGDYWIEGKVSKDGEVKTVYACSLKILANFASDADVAPGYDGRTFSRRVRDSLRAMVEGSAEFPEMAYTIFGERNVQLVPLEERMRVLALFESKVAEEEKGERAGRGERTGIYMRFRSPQ